MRTIKLQRTDISSAKDGQWKTLFKTFPLATWLFPQGNGESVDSVYVPWPSYLLAKAARNYAEDAGTLPQSVSLSKIPWRKKWQPIPVFLPGKSHGQRSLAGYWLPRRDTWGHQRDGYNLVTKQQQQTTKVTTAGWGINGFSALIFGFF